MTGERELERVLERWLVDGVNEMPDRVYYSILDHVERQQQRPAWRLRAWRSPIVSTPLKLVLVGAALVAALAAGSILMSGGARQGPAPATPTPAPTATPTPTPTPPSLPHGKLDPGTYVAHPLKPKPMTWTITVPAGWAGYEDWAVYADLPEGDPGVVVGGPSEGIGIPTDSCAAAGTPFATSVDDVIEAVQARDDWTVSAPVDVTVSGFSGTRIDFEVPADVKCPDNKDYMVIVEEPDGTGFYAQGPSNQFRMWVLDVEGDPIVVQRNSFANTPAELVAQGDAIVNTGVIAP